MPVELFDQIITDFFSHANSFDNVFSTLDKDLNNLNAFTYHRISLVHVNKYEDVVVAHDTRGDDLFQKKTLFVVDADHQLNIIGVDPIIPGDDAGVVLNYYLQELKIVDDSQRELRFHLGRMENTYQI